ncbi:ATP synthase F(0) complex subunit k, mitochondrial-like [Rhynchophorus ferrugineus]|uniref:ATP synthase F(0) complex subunit k, mitochondrial-like n=1 Tax=Rhynchophorus ferrugineus TaxID=354439 RepID=UPI003FCCBE6F
MSKDEEHEPFDDPKLKGISRYFNGTTVRGRANVAIATYGILAATFVYYKFLKTTCPECPEQSVK